MSSSIRDRGTIGVLMGGLSRFQAAYLKQIYRNGGKDYFDIVNIHPFTDPLLPNAMEGYRGTYRAVYKAMEKYSDTNKPIWFTEIGCPGLASSESVGWWSGKSPDEEGQAKWVMKVYQEGLKWPGVQRIFWAFFRDTSGHFGNDVDHFGLIRNDFSEKPSYAAYQKIAKKES